MHKAPTAADIEMRRRCRQRVCAALIEGSLCSSWRWQLVCGPDANIEPLLGGELDRNISEYGVGERFHLPDRQTQDGLPVGRLAAGHRAPEKAFPFDREANQRAQVVTPITSFLLHFACALARHFTHST